MKKIAYETLELAYRRWMEFYGIKETSIPDRGWGFRKFIDDDLTDYGRGDKRLSRTTETRLAMLASPHWYALLKAYDAKRKQYEGEASGEGK